MPDPLQALVSFFAEIQMEKLLREWKPACGDLVSHSANWHYIWPACVAPETAR